MKPISQSAKSWARRLMNSLVIIILLAVGVDYGKHFLLKHSLEAEILNSNGLVAYTSMSVSPWPLLHGSILITQFEVNSPDAPLHAKTVTIRQGWQNWHLAQVSASEIKAFDSVTIQTLEGVLDSSQLKTHVNISDLILSHVKIKLPLYTLLGEKAHFDFLYNLKTYELLLSTDAQNLSFENGASFGFKGNGKIHTHQPIKGKIDLKIQNIDKLMSELVTKGVVNSSQAEMLTMGSNFLGKIGLHDISLPLIIENGQIYLGPLPLYQLGKNN